MSRALGRGAFGVTLRRCAWLAALPTLATVLVAALAAAAAAPTVADPQAACGAFTPHLGAPLLVLAAANALAVLRLWPCFGTDRPGAELARRWAGGTARPIAAAAAAALLVQFVFGAAVLAALGGWLGAGGAAHAEFVAEPLGPAALLPEQPHLRAPLPQGTVACAVVLRPLAALPRATFAPSEVLVRGDGELLGPAAVFQQSHEFAVLGFPPRPLQELALELRSGTVPLAFPPGALVVRDARAHHLLANVGWGAALTTLPLLLAIAAAFLASARASHAVVLLVAGTVLFVASVGGIGGFRAAVHAVLTGRWLGMAAIWPALPSLATGFLAMIGGMLLQARLPR